MTPITTCEEFEAALEHGPYTSVGSYPIYFVTANSDVLSYQAARDNMAEVIEAFSSDDPEWRVIGFEINWESELYCEHTGEPIEAAYEIVRN